LNKRIDRNSKRFKCTADHVDFCFPTQHLIVDRGREVENADDTRADDSFSDADEEQLNANCKMNLHGSSILEEDFLAYAKPLIH
jgi:hypothetical protein